MKTKYTEVKIEKERDHNDPSYVGYMAIHFNATRDEMAKFFTLSFEERIEKRAKEVCRNSVVKNEDWSILILPSSREEYINAPALVGFIRKCEALFDQQISGEQNAN